MQNLILSKQHSFRILMQLANPGKFSKYLQRKRPPSRKGIPNMSLRCVLGGRSYCVFVTFAPQTNLPLENQSDIPLLNSTFSQSVALFSFPNTRVCPYAYASVWERELAQQPCGVSQPLEVLSCGLTGVCIRPCGIEFARELPNGYVYIFEQV